MNTEIKEKIISVITDKNYFPLKPPEFFEFICGEGYDENEVFETLCEMEENFDIVITKKGKVINPQEVGILKGTFSSGTRGKYGFVSTECGEFFIPAAFSLGAMQKDSVVIKKFDSGSRFFTKGNEAEVIAILERNTDKITGTFKVTYHSERFKSAYVMPDDQRIHTPIPISAKNFGNANDGDKVICQILKYPVDENDNFSGRVVEILGRADTLEANYKAVLRENGIIEQFDSKVLEEAEAVASEELSTKDRLDLRDKIIFTIDGADAKDLDDAISLDIIDNGYILGVHIADVSHYVRENTFLDKEAMQRGTSVYFTDKVVPMLPKALSNGICSLNGGVDRYALSAFMTLDKNGNIISTDIKNTIINSKVRGVYSELNDIIENGENSNFYQKYEHVLNDFYKMLELYAILKTKSKNKGALDLEGEESKIILDENGHPVDIVKRERGESEKLIEQFMLCANEGVATYLKNAHLPCVYRIHEEPDREKMNAFMLFAKNLGVDVSPMRTKNEIKPSQLAKVLENAHNVDKFDIVSSVLLRSLMKAKYSSTPKAHFGLATENYCHFTSPIRRYPDLSVHRIIKSLLSGNIDEHTINKFEKFATESAIKSSENELKAIYAEREIDDLYKCVYMADRIGETFSATICSVTSFGFFARTENLCEGLVPIEYLGRNFYFDERNYTLSCGDEVYSLGQSVEIKVEDADIIKKRVTFSLASKKIPKEKGFEHTPRHLGKERSKAHAKAKAISKATKRKSSQRKSKKKNKRY